MSERPNRRSIRLPEWDYRSPRFYFVTICTNARRNLFADERLRELAANAWTHIPDHPHAEHVVIDEWVVMPNHLHGILHFTKDLEAFEAAELRATGLLPGSLGAVVGNYKMGVTRRVKSLWRATGSDLKVWQRGYWERIVRNERELEATREYIRLNPLRWADDRDNLDALLLKMNHHDGA